MQEYRIKIISFFCFLFSASFFYAQINLVPNPSFEYTVSCPLGPDDATKCQSWSSYRNSPDYFNSCDPFINNVSTPFNFGGYQVPKSGNAYMGVLTYYSQTQIPGFREYLGAKLTNTLTLSQKYFFSMRWVATKSSVGPSNCYSNNLGVTFSKKNYTAGNPYPINNLAKVYSTTISNDTVNWNIIKGSFIADSAYEYVIIGNFFNDNSTDTLIFDSNPNCMGAYYFIDDVCVSTDSIFTFNYIPAGVSEFSKNNNRIKIYPNPTNDIFILEKPEEDENYYIMNVMGIMVKEGFCKGKKHRIDVSDLDNGLYFLVLRENRVKILINH